MACPYFYPVSKAEGVTQPARAPLGALYDGRCEIGGAAGSDACNFGYAAGRCDAFPSDAVADAVRFTTVQGRTIYVLEKDYSPLRHGGVESLDGGIGTSGGGIRFVGRPVNTPLLTPRPVRESASDYSEVALPNDANPLGNLLGGRVMHLVDLAGALAAARHSRCPVVTASVDSMTFLHPIHIGQLIILKSAVNRVFRTSMEVGVKVWVEDLRTGVRRHTSSAYLTFVALGPNNERVPVAPVVPETEDEKRRFDSALLRREYRLSQKKQEKP